MIYIVTIFMVTMQVGSQFPNKTNKVKKKTCVTCVSFEIVRGDFMGKQLSKVFQFSKEEKNKFWCKIEKLENGDITLNQNEYIQ